MGMVEHKITCEVVIVDEDGREFPFSPELLLPVDAGGAFRHEGDSRADPSVEAGEHGSCT